METYGMYPCDSCWLSQDFKSNHRANDFGWLTKYGAKLPVKAWKSGTVIATGTDSAGGVYVIIQHEHDDATWISRYWHFVKGSLKVKKGDNVKQGQVLGIRGNSGISTGVHLHFELWKCPKGYAYKSSDRSKYAVNPRKYCYIFENQVIRIDGAAKKPEEPKETPEEAKIRILTEKLNAIKELLNGDY